MALTHRQHLLKVLFYHKIFKLPELDLDSLAPPLPSDFAPILEELNLPCPPKFQHDDFHSLMRMVKAVNPQVVLELGTAHGNTTANICAHSNARVYTVNALPEQISGNSVTFVTALQKHEIGRVYRDSGFSDRVVQIFENTLSLDYTRYIDGKTVDLVIIDACHDYDYVLNDFFQIQPVLKFGAVVLFHDTSPIMKMHLASSYWACMHLRRKGYDIRHIKDTWWGYWVKPSGPDTLGFLALQRRRPHILRPIP
jgi:predicted O-methyltransferase YrrM